MFLDTSGLLPLVRVEEAYHADARTHFDAADRRVTHNYVFAELLPLADRRGVSRQVVFDLLDDLKRSPLVHVYWVDPNTHASAMALLRSRRDKGYSLCDAVSFIVMRVFELNEALTTDHHFEQEGFVRLLK